MTEENQAKVPPIRVAICMPTRGALDYKTAQSLAELTGTLGATMIADGILDITLLMLPGTYIDKARSQITQEAIKWGATHMLWLDDDMVFPRYTLHKLLTANADIVGVNYPTRKQPIVPVTFKRVPSKTEDFKGERCFTTEESFGLEEVEAIGFGCVLVRSSVFAKVAYPGFLCEYNGPDGTWTGEDVFFCLKAREQGFKVMVDHDLSKDIGHVGRMVYENEHAEAYRQFSKPAIVPASADVLETLNGVRHVH